MSQNDKLISDSGLRRALQNIKTWVTAITKPITFKYRNKSNKLVEEVIDGTSEKTIDMSDGVYYATTSTTATRVSNELTINNNGEVTKWDGSQKAVIDIASNSILELFTNYDGDIDYIDYRIYGESEDAVEIIQGDRTITRTKYPDNEIFIYGKSSSYNRFGVAAVYLNPETDETIVGPLNTEGLQLLNEEVTMYIDSVRVSLSYTGDMIYDEDNDIMYDKWRIETATCWYTNESGDNEINIIDALPINPHLESTQGEMILLRPGEYVYFEVHNDDEYSNLLMKSRNPEIGHKYVFYLSEGEDTLTNKSIPRNIVTCASYGGNNIWSWNSIIMDAYELGGYDEPVSKMGITYNYTAEPKTILHKPINVILDKVTGHDDQNHIIVLPNINQLSNNISMDIYKFADGECYNETILYAYDPGEIPNNSGLLPERPSLPTMGNETFICLNYEAENGRYYVTKQRIDGYTLYTNNVDDFSCCYVYNITPIFDVFHRCWIVRKV